MASPLKSHSDPHPAGEEKAIRDQVDRILATPPFRRAERLRQFLRFIAERKLAGEAGDLKETVIGHAVYGRAPGYDPKADPIVRTEARRLRAKLLVYEQTNGAEDPLVVRLPVGGYAPTFEFRVPAPTPALEVPPKFTTVKWGIRTWIGAVALALAALALWLLSPAQRLPEPSITPVTSYPGLESAPSFSPDGKQAAFVWNGRDGNLDIYTKELTVDTPHRLTTSPAQDLNPAWSPDGTAIAFLRAWSDGRGEVGLVPANGGTERLIAATHPVRGAWRPDAADHGRSLGPVWTPDGRNLVVTDRCESDGASPDCLFLLNLDGRRMRKLTSPPHESLSDTAAAISPDGSQVAFVRAFNARETTELYVQPLNGGEARPLTPDGKTVTAVAWGGERIFFASNRTGESRLWSVPARGGTPEAVAAAGQRVGDLAVTRDGRRLLYVESFSNTNIWRLDLSHAAASPAEPVKLLASSRKNDSAQYSPDGRRICFVSDRTGTAQLWMANADGSNPAVLTSFANGTPVGTPRWSPAGDRIAFDSARNGHSVIYEMALNGSAPRLLASDGGDDMMPSWSRDGRFVYFLRRDGSQRAIWRRPAAGGAAERLVDGAYADAQESADGKTLYFSKNAAGIWQASSAGGPPEPIPELKDVVDNRYFAVVDRGIYFVVGEECPSQVAFFDFASRRVSPVAIVRKTPVFRTPSLSVSPDGRWLLYAQVDESGSDLMLADFK
jgi:Tol biopolymer transport system component